MARYEHRRKDTKVPELGGVAWRWAMTIELTERHSKYLLLLRNLKHHTAEMRD